MKTDFHSHILPGLDDGATDMGNALELAAAMKSWGFERITCTPHINALYRNTPGTIRPIFEKFREVLYVNGIDVELKMSAEYRLVPETWPQVLENNWLMPIEDRYILTELPISDPERMENIRPVEEFKRLIAMGLTPILPHPERYDYLTHDELLRYLDAGAVIQCNYGSLAGLYGDVPRQRVMKMQQEGLVTFYATDMHNMHYVKVIGDWLHNHPL